MIIGLFVKNVKTYSGINFIPLTYNNNFCGIIGKNGCGKSSILEALDYILNDRAEWNYHISYKKQGLKSSAPYIVPVFLIAKKNIKQKKEQDILEEYSNIFWELKPSEVNSANSETCKEYAKFRELVRSYYSPQDFYLLAVGSDYSREPSIAIFDGVSRIKKEKDNLDELRKITLNLYDYVYIPKDIEPEKMMKLETEELQIVLGKTLQDIISNIFDNNKITELNTKLLEFTNELSSKLGDYQFKTVQERQIAIRKNTIYDLIITDFFAKRKLHKDFQGRPISISMLSSGEKQQAILDLYYNLIMYSRESDKLLIIGIDEPEASLHISACYAQLDKLYTLCSSCSQVLFTSHWYGFIPTIEKGGIVKITVFDDDHTFDLFDIERYREQIKKQIEDKKGYFPLEISLKGLNDFIQSIISSVVQERPYNWLLCEGSSDKIYLSAYLKDEISNKKLRIIPVGGIGEIAKIYKQLLIFFEDSSIKKEIKGKVFLLSDTDKQLDRYTINTGLINLVNKRLLLDEDGGKITLVHVNSNIVSPATDIEDSMNGRICKQVLQILKEDNPALSFIDENEAEETCSALALKLDRDCNRKLKEFYNSDNNKYIVAKKYVELLKGENITPEWITEIKNYFA